MTNSHLQYYISSCYDYPLKKDNPHAHQKITLSPSIPHKIFFYLPRYIWHMLIHWYGYTYGHTPMGMEYEYGYMDTSVGYGYNI